MCAVCGCPGTCGTGGAVEDEGTTGPAVGLVELGILVGFAFAVVPVWAACLGIDGYAEACLADEAIHIDATAWIYYFLAGLAADWTGDTAGGCLCG